jgi:hypothetical protein
MTPTEAKRIGRPLKAPAKAEKRVQIGPLIRASIKRDIDAAAKLSGRTLSQEAEFLIERGLLADTLAKLGNTTQEGIYHATLTAIMARYGLAPKWGHDADGKSTIIDWERRKLGGFIDTKKEDK